VKSSLEGERRDRVRREDAENFPLDSGDAQGGTAHRVQKKERRLHPQRKWNNSLERGLREGGVVREGKKARKANAPQETGSESKERKRLVVLTGTNREALC